jgi:predicted phosphodiesterase
MAKVAVISDIHGNLPALEATLAAIRAERIREVLCLGDVVGYGADPGPCLERVWDACTVLVRGNHEDALLDPAAARSFNPVARFAIEWTRRATGWDHLGMVKAMRSIFEGGNRLTLVHDSPAPMAGGGYLHDARTAAIAFRGFDSRICIVGHTHVPVAFTAPGRSSRDPVDPSDVEAVALVDGEEWAWPREGRAIVNPGSVGQPRDGDPRASFAVLDLERGTFGLRRVEYDVARAQADLRRVGLPSPLVDRLAVGA